MGQLIPGVEGIYAMHLEVQNHLRTTESKEDTHAPGSRA